MENILGILPGHIGNVIKRLNNKESITEIHLRVNKPVIIRIDGSLCTLSNGGYSRILTGGITISLDEINSVFFSLCNNSVYSHEKEIANGFISLRDGGRAGICGTTVNGNIRDITSINIRIAHEIKDVAKNTENLSGGILVCGPPHSGKTTYLRDFVRLKSNSGKSCTIVDCRGEIAAVKGGIPTLDVGINTDVISFGAKSEGIEAALRGMAPDIIAFDEIGTRDELASIISCLNSGVDVITTLHSGSKESLIARNRQLPILDTGAFSHIVFLDKNYNEQILEVGEILAKADRCCDNYDFIGFPGTPEDTKINCKGYSA